MGPARPSQMQAFSFNSRPNDYMIIISLLYFNLPFQTLHRGFSLPASSTYTAVEAPKGEFGMQIILRLSNKGIQA